MRVGVLAGKDVDVFGEWVEVEVILEEAGGGVVEERVAGALIGEE